jgi:predicted acetyltransferase
LLFDVGSPTHVDPACEHVMTRIVDAPGAIAARGWAPVRATVELVITDGRRGANHGPFVLEVADRSATLTPGGSGYVSVDVRALASLYTGFTTASALAAAGRVTGDPRSLATLDDASRRPRRACATPTDRLRRRTAAGRPTPRPDRRARPT